ncbi:MAG TPA: enoyl-CoA hydratase/isomerase family protein [Intrasporangiaceae bacterium]|nr:enoyl-CoA hydratase/isomerase family protein [Intrasporangiaceae bacterium]
MSEPEVLFSQQGALGRILLNRPRAINALTHDMVGMIDTQLDEWATDDSVAAVVVTGAGERGLCAGGDIRSIYEDAQEQGGASEQFWADEYRLNLKISRYPKPYIAIMDGLVMGGGVGVSVHGSHRIATDRSRIAMPEVGIGFVPDVGGTYVLSRSPGVSGLHAGLTGAQMGAADAIHTGFADAYIPHDRVEDFLAAVADGTHPDAAVQEFAEQPEPGTFEDLEALADCYAHDTAAQIVAAMEADGSDLATKTAATIRANSPVSVEVTLAAIRRVRELPDLAEALRQELRVSIHALRTGDFVEGIRAQIIDKDRNPQWQPARLEDVDPDVVAAYFDSLGDEELVLPDA